METCFLVWNVYLYMGLATCYFIGMSPEAFCMFIYHYKGNLRVDRET